MLHSKGKNHQNTTIFTNEKNTLKSVYTHLKYLPFPEHVNRFINVWAFSLVSFTWHNAFEIHPGRCMYQFIPFFYGYMDVYYLIMVDEYFFGGTVGELLEQPLDISAYRPYCGY